MALPMLQWHSEGVSATVLFSTVEQPVQVKTKAARLTFE